MSEAVWALSALGATVAGVMFCLHWRRSRDRFFLYFAIAFWSLGASSVILLTTSGPAENRPSAYVVRLLAFVLIIVAIVDKNRPRHANRDMVPFDAEPDEEAAERVASLAGDP
jgi:hypothetical protein